MILYRLEPIRNNRNRWSVKKTHLWYAFGVPVRCFRQLVATLKKAEPKIQSTFYKNHKVNSKAWLLRYLVKRIHEAPSDIETKLSGAVIWWACSNESSPRIHRNNPTDFGLEEMKTRYLKQNQPLRTDKQCLSHAASWCKVAGMVWDLRLTGLHKPEKSTTTMEKGNLASTPEKNYKPIE